MSKVLRRVHNIDDMRLAAKRRLPHGMFEFFDRGTEDEVALANNRQALDAIKLVPEALADVSARTLETPIFGRVSPLPVGIAPTGAAGLMWYNGEVAVARAAAAAGIPYALSTVSLASIEQVAEQAGGRLWFQLYFSADPAISEEMIDRARACGYEALVLTVDTVGSPNREYNLRNGFGVPVSFNTRNVMDGLRHPRWLTGVFLKQYLRQGAPRFANFPQDGSRLTSRRAGDTMEKKQDLSLDDLRRLRRLWRGPLIVKGILSAKDAVRMVDCGADAVVLSNHGARNLDSVPAPIEVLPEVCDAVGGRASIFIDSGFRRGSDVVKALALGADMVMLGRAPLYGAAVAGEAGVARVIDLMRAEIDRVLTFVGCRDVNALGREIVRLPQDTSGR